MKFAKFLMVGGAATLIQYGLLIVFVERLMIEAVIASASSYALSSIFNYLMNYYFTFSSGADHGKSSIKFAVVAIIGLALNTCTMYLFVNMLNIHYVLSQVVATGVVLFWNYFVHKNWTYKTVKGKD
jgi:putative flippase GtrA